MTYIKELKDKLGRTILGSLSVPTGLSELNHYFRMYGPIQFQLEQQEDGTFIAISQNYKYGSIITRIEDRSQVDTRIMDAILTAFEVPSSYAKEADLKKVESSEYAFA